MSKSMKLLTYCPASLWMSSRHLRLNKHALDCSSWSRVCYLSECSIIHLIVRLPDLSSSHQGSHCCQHDHLNSPHLLLPSPCLFSSKGSLYLLFKIMEWLSMRGVGWGGHIRVKILPLPTQPSMIWPFTIPAAPFLTLLALHSQPFYTTLNLPYSFQSQFQGIRIIRDPLCHFGFPHST